MGPKGNSSAIPAHSQWAEREAAGVFPGSNIVFSRVFPDALGHDGAGISHARLNGVVDEVAQVHDFPGHPPHHRKTIDMKNPAILTDSYQLPAESNLLLTVIIGDAQMGTTAIWKNETFVSEGDYDRADLGTAQQWDGKELRVKTPVADINSFTNKMDVTYKLEGGPAPYEKTVPFEVDSDGDVAIFRAIFEIKSN